MQPGGKGRGAALASGSLRPAPGFRGPRSRRRMGMGPGLCPFWGADSGPTSAPAPGLQSGCRQSTTPARSLPPCLRSTRGTALARGVLVHLAFIYAPSPAYRHTRARTHTHPPPAYTHAHTRFLLLHLFFWFSSFLANLKSNAGLKLPARIDQFGSVVNFFGDINDSLSRLY